MTVPVECREKKREGDRRVKNRGWRSRPFEPIYTREDEVKRKFDRRKRIGTLADRRQPPHSVYDFQQGGPPTTGQPPREGVLAERVKRLEAIERAVLQYVSDYELRGDGADHTPTAEERVLIVDAIQGLLVDEDFLKAFALRALEGPTQEEVEAASETLDADDLIETNPFVICARAILRWAGRDERRERGE